MKFKTGFRRRVPRHQAYKTQWIQGFINLDGKTHLSPKSVQQDALHEAKLRLRFELFPNKSEARFGPDLWSVLPSSSQRCDRDMAVHPKLHHVIQVEVKHPTQDKVVGSLLRVRTKLRMDRRKFKTMPADREEEKKNEEDFLTANRLQSVFCDKNSRAVSPPASKGLMLSFLCVSLTDAPPGRLSVCRSARTSLRTALVFEPWRTIIFFWFSCWRDDGHITNSRRRIIATKLPLQQKKHLRVLEHVYLRLS